MKLRVAAAAALLCASAAVAQILPDPVAEDAYAPVRLEEAQLGQLLFYDPILSGNRNIACATCHHPSLGTADGVALAIGEGGVGLGPDRRVDPKALPEKRIPRNAPALFNLGAREFTVLFHDGRLEADADSPDGIRTPMDADMVLGFDSILSAQTMFPVLSRDEMAGSFRENDVGRAVRQGLITGADGAWGIIAARVAAMPAYADAFVMVYPHIDRPDQIAFTDISNAIAAFMAFEWRSDTSPFDIYLRGEVQMRNSAFRGMTVFYGKGKCSNCHAGVFQTDHSFHAMGAPQIGPGKAADFESHALDEGRMRVTGDLADRFAFRTPSLRNVMLTAPYGHAGGHASLKAFIIDHADPVAALEQFDPETVTLPMLEVEDFAIMKSPDKRAMIGAAVGTKPLLLAPADVDDLMAFLNTLTDPVAFVGRLGVPDAVPSGLPVPNPE